MGKDRWTICFLHFFLTSWSFPNLCEFFSNTEEYWSSECSGVSVVGSDLFVQPWKSTYIWREFCYCNIWWIGFRWELICVQWEIGSFCTLFVMEWKITFAIARTAPLVRKQILLQRAGMHLRQCQGDSPNNGSLEWTGRF